MKLDLRFKDKVFIFIVGAGLLFALINNFYSKQIKKDDSGMGDFQTETEVDNNSSKNEIVENQAEKKEISSQARVSIANSNLEVFVARTEAERYQGLSDQDYLEEGRGMLFLFGNYGNYRFVMRGMRFDLDFIFIRDNEVVGLKKTIKKDFSGEIFVSDKYDKVLEINSGWIEKNGILIRDKIGVDYF